ncbi:conserved hypothetical protein [Talaromyces stipitatus ATCC 10500]|uniref:Aminoglycoside phosphotransferase domain-containing protein n=1 Tax=Talaromyces stipitatus (strain ATCC 10500 / CBS 375.48 / QM 6759 / NRRL 1006) TaxID=441959 RepID=B8MKU1_TALSN|nr:uncharacterized protein TSTA_044070 [Talaromyces stipitatus ATCC 10500]EED14940.1 conserved hypothetical protein [Talaromyces stipitatus ATCC 10500]
MIQGMKWVLHMLIDELPGTPLLLRMPPALSEQLQKQLAELRGWNAFETDLDDGSFFLKHMDDKCDYILVDNNYNITGFINCAFVKVVPAYKAFGHSLFTLGLNDLLNGKSGLSSQDKVMADVLRDSTNPGHMMSGLNLVRRFSFGLSMGVNLSWDEANALFKGIVSTATVWYQNRTHEWADNSRLKTLLIRQGNNMCNRTNLLDLFYNQLYKIGSSWTKLCKVQEASMCTVPVEEESFFITYTEWNQLDDDAWEKEINKEVSELISQVNSHELDRLATQLNNNIPCKFQPGKHISVGATMGCANYHGWLIFDNDERWIVRVPRRGFTNVPSEMVKYLVESEYATLKFLEPVNVSISKVYGYRLVSDPSNRVGVCYIMMQALPGQPYYAHEASPDPKRRVIEQGADYMNEVCKHPLPLAGSFIMKDNQPTISAVASNRFVALGIYGPFTSTSDYIMSMSIIDQYMDLFADGQLRHKYVLEAFLFYYSLRNNKDCLTTPDIPGQLFLKDVDDKGHHILADDEYNVIGIIDWQFAPIVPAADAFGPSYVTADLAFLYSSSNSISANDILLADALRS